MAMENKAVLPTDYVVCIYARLSVEDADTGEVKTESNSITAQRQLIRDYLNSHSEFARCRVMERCDDGFSGTHFDTRPAFTDMIEMVKRGEVACIIVKDFSRFGRNYVELGDYLEQLFPFLGVRFISINDGYDSADLKDGETAGLSVAFQNIVYDYYSKELSAKARISCRQKAEHGLFKACYAPYGYRKDPADKRKLLIEPEEAAIVREIYDMRLGGMNMADIARRLNERGVPTPAVRLSNKGMRKSWHGRSEGFTWLAEAVRRILKNEVYTGTLVAIKSTTTEPGGKKKCVPAEEWIRVEGTHEAIISRETFLEVQKMFKKVNMGTAKLKGYFHCGYCGRALRNQNLNTCSMKCQRGVVGNNEGCRNVSLKNVKAKESVLKAIQQKIKVFIDAEEMRKAGMDENDPDRVIQATKKAMDSEKRSWMKMYDEYADGKIDRDHFLRYKVKYDERLDGLKNKLEEAEMRKKQIALNEGEDKEKFEEVLAAKELTQEIMGAFIDHVDVFEGDRIHIYWKFDPE